MDDGPYGYIIKKCYIVTFLFQNQVQLAFFALLDYV
jgi:hypothetical protein